MGSHLPYDTLMADLKEYLKILSDEASAAAWSRGVSLAKTGSLQILAQSDSEVEAIVALAARPVSVRVNLWLSESDWYCECRGREDPCEHVIASALVCRHNDKPSAAPKKSSSRFAVQYRFEGLSNGRLAVKRGIVKDDVFQPISVPLTTLVTRRGDILASKIDLTVDQLLSRHLGPEPLPSGVMAKLISYLHDIDVQVNGVSKLVSRHPFGHFVIVDRYDGRYRVRVAKDPGALDFFKNGCVVTSEKLHIATDPAPDSEDREILHRGLFFADHQVVELVSDTLPRWRQSLPIEIRVELPGVQEFEPRLVVEAHKVAEGMQVVGQIVYGDPVVATLHRGNLTPVGPEIPIRDRQSELRLAAEFERKWGQGLDQPFELVGEAAVRAAKRLQESSFEIRGSGVEQFRPVATSLRPTVNVGWNDGEVSVMCVFQADDGSAADSSAVMAAWQRGDTLVPLMSGGYAPLPKDALSRFGATLQMLLEDSGADRPVPNHRLPAICELGDELGFHVPREIREKLTPKPFSPPVDLTAELRSYQQSGVEWLNIRKNLQVGALLADDMGLGKTLQSLAVIDGRCLVVAPTSTLFNWQNELRRFRPSLRISLYHGLGREIDQDADVTLTSYGTLRMDVERLASVVWDSFILDEAQAIKNPMAQVSRAVCKVPARFRLALTGTPVENSLVDLWSQFHFLNPGLLGSYQEFAERYRGESSEAELDGLRRRVDPFILRRTKEQVARDLPEKTELLRHCDLSEPERALYDSLLAITRTELQKLIGEGARPMAALEQLLRLRQAACHWGLLPGQDHGSSAKTEFLLGELEQLLPAGHKVLVFSQWTSFLDRIERELAAQGWGSLRIDGATRDRGAVVDEFQSDGGTQILLLSLKAAGVGLNLTAADHVYILDPWWNPAAEAQAADRAHRIGQTKPVFVHKVIARDTVEEKIIQLQEAKKSLAADVVQVGGRTLSHAEVLELLT